MFRVEAIIAFCCLCCNYVNSIEHLEPLLLEALAQELPIKWRSIAILTNHSSQDHVLLQCNLVKIVIDLEHLEITQTSRLQVDAYVFQSERFQVVKSVIEQGLAKKYFNPTKPFIVYLKRLPMDLGSQNEQLFEQIDLIMAHKTPIWDPSTQSTAPVVKLVRYRTTSRFPASELIGYFDGRDFDHSARRMLADQTFTYGRQIIPVTAFSLPPTTFQCGTSGSDLCGRDINLIRTFGEKLDFIPVFVEPPFNSKWGDQLANGTWTGMVGQVSRGRTLMGVANMFMASIYLQHIDASYPYAASCSTFMTPGLKPLAQWRALIRPFDLNSWVVTLASLVFGGLSISVFSKMYVLVMKRPANNRFHLISEAMFQNMQAITGVKCPEDTSKWPIRWYITIWWLFCFLIGTIYRAILTASLTVPVTMPPIDTLSQLSKSDLTPYSYGKLLSDLAQRSSDRELVQFTSKLQVVPPNVSIADLMSTSSVAFYESQNYLAYHALRMSQQSTGPPPHVMKECIHFFPVSVALTPRSPFKRPVDHLIHRLNEAGIIQHWVSSTLSTNNYRPTSKTDDKNKAFSMHHLEGAFLLLLLCFAICILTLLVELVINKYHADA